MRLVSIAACVKNHTSLVFSTKYTCYALCFVRARDLEMSRIKTRPSMLGFAFEICF